MNQKRKIRFNLGAIDIDQLGEGIFLLGIEQDEIEETR